MVWPPVNSLTAIGEHCYNCVTQIDSDPYDLVTRVICGADSGNICTARAGTDITVEAMTSITQTAVLLQMMEGREEAVREVKSQIEADLTLLGATGVEDLLQEEVQETLESLRVAGIKVCHGGWVGRLVKTDLA